MEKVVYQVSTHLDGWAANLALGPLAWQLRPGKSCNFSAQFGEFLEKFDQNSVSLGAGSVCHVVGCGIAGSACWSPRIGVEDIQPEPCVTKPDESFNVRLYMLRETAVMEYWR